MFREGWIGRGLVAAAEAAGEEEEPKSLRGLGRFFSLREETDAPASDPASEAVSETVLVLVGGLSIMSRTEIIFGGTAQASS
jgi:hypothetical protein